MPYALFDYVPGGPHTMGEMDNGQGEVQPVIGDRAPYDVFAVSGVESMDGGWMNKGYYGYWNALRQAYSGKSTGKSK